MSRRPRKQPVVAAFGALGHVRVAAGLRDLATIYRELSPAQRRLLVARATERLGLERAVVVELLEQALREGEALPRTETKK